MHFKRLTNINDSVYPKAVALYQNSFPIFEQRTSSAQIAAIQCEEYHFDIIYDGELFVGLLLYWETPSFIYVEHFCIDTALRSKGYGQKSLQLLGEKNKLIILEIDPPIDDISVRRKKFYCGVGYHENPFIHIHPPYRPQDQGHPLVVMSNPHPLTNEQYQSFIAYIKDTAMAAL